MSGEEVMGKREIEVIGEGFWGRVFIGLCEEERIC